jgi:pimeloyl-ACP methyl ester carboxylesterase
MRTALSGLVAAWANRMLLGLALVLAGAGAGTAQPVIARQDVAVIFLHGRLGSPAYLAPLLQALRADGYRAETPVMSWSRSRAFDSTVEESMVEVDTIAAKLRAQGARRVVVAGHSLGGAAALRYGATRQGVDALVLVAASWNPAGPGWQRVVGESVARARAAIDAGRDRATDTYQYVANDGSAAPVVAVARGFHDFNRSDSPMGVPANARAFTRTLPVLWLSADADSRSARDTAAKAFAALPRHPRSRQDTITSSHSAAATAAIPAITAWLDQAWR